MAEPESILQLGIEAARENKKEEARQLFRLLTRQEPNNAQGWLWLAGVAESREERQAALERVIELDPENEMARTNLQAMRLRPPPVAPLEAPVVEAPPAPVVEPPAATNVRVYDAPDDDDPFAELNNLSDVMADDKAGPVRRAEPVAADNSAADAAVVAGAAAAATAAGAAGAAARSADASARSAARSADANARGSRNTARYVEDDELEPPRRGISPLLGLLLFLVGLGLIGLLIYGLFGNNNNQVAESGEAATAAALTAGPAGQPTTALGGGAGTGATADPNATAAPGGAVDPNATAAPGGAVDPNATAAPGGAVDPNATAAPGGEQPGASIPDSQLASANPAVIPANTPINSEGWVYDFPQATYAASIIGNLGQYTPSNGRFVVVLVHAINNTGAPQSIPANFFVLKDAQGRIWNARPEVSDAYVVPGVNADQTHNTPIAPDGNYRSVALIFDVAPDATDLTFFARTNPAQGWIVLRSV
jgi:hypothetical protein